MCAGRQLHVGHLLHMHIDVPAGVMLAGQSALSYKLHDVGESTVYGMTRVAYKQHGGCGMSTLH